MFRFTVRVTMSPPPFPLLDGVLYYPTRRLVTDSRCEFSKNRQSYSNPVRNVVTDSEPLSSRKTRDEAKGKLFSTAVETP